MSPCSESLTSPKARLPHANWSSECWDGNSPARGCGYNLHAQKGRGKPYVFVSFASFCMISKIILQAAEQPSGVEWMLIAFSAAPAFSLRCTSILQAQH